MTEREGEFLQYFKAQGPGPRGGPAGGWLSAPWVGTRAPGRVSVRGDASVCMVSPSAALRVRYVVCGSWDPLALLGPVLGPWVCFDDLGGRI